MGILIRFQTAVVSASLALVAMLWVCAAQADTPSCDAVVQDSTIPTCTCICEAGSLFPGCDGLKPGTAAATPGQCPDMLQGRRVLSRGDALAVAAPRNSGTFNTVALASIYQAENDPTNPGLGRIEGYAAVTQNPNVGCRMQGGTAIPFPEQVRFARLFDLPYAMMVQLRPNNDRTQVKESYCYATDVYASNMLMVMTSSQSGAPSVPTYAWQTNPEWVQLAVGDFNYDGYDDLVFLNKNVIQVYTAVDPKDPSKGIKRVASVNTTLPDGALRAPINRPVVGDFNGDGIMDVAWIGGNFPNSTGTLSVYFASICPGSVAGTICAGAAPFQVILDPASKLFPGVSGATSTIALEDATLTPTPCGIVTLAGNKASGPLRAGAIALGNFASNGFNSRGAPVDGLVVAYIAGTSADPGAHQCRVYVQYLSYARPDSSNPVWARQHGPTMTNLFHGWINGVSSPTYSLYAQAAHLDWYGPTEQAVIGVTGYTASGGVVPTTAWVPITVSVKGSGDGARPSACSAVRTLDPKNFRFAWGVATGRFSTSTTVNPDNPQACGDFASADPGDCPYNPQISMLMARDNQITGGIGDPIVDLYSVVASDPDGSDNSRKCSNDGSVQGYLPVLSSITHIHSGYHSVPPGSLRAGNMLSAGDAFGNAVRLGPPTITRVSEHSEPQFVIQAPPSLVDYLQPNEQDSHTPAIVNFTRSPEKYMTQIQYDTGSQDTASTSETESFGASTTETVSGEVKFKIPLVKQISAKSKNSWTQFNDETESTQLGTYATTRLQTGGDIGDDDQVWWTETTFNVFNFPEIGVSNCPADTTCEPGTPGCSGAASGIALTCTNTNDGCQCLSADASNSICPAMPSEPDTRSCVTQGGHTCCSLLPEPLNVSFSGPQEVIRSSTDGAAIEWYQPKHEPGQILSYPANTVLLRRRNAGSEGLATLTSFSTGTNNTSESMSWNCGTTSNVSSGTTTRHSFASDNSITIGTNKLAKEAVGGGSLSIGIKYQQSDSFSTLNTYTVGQTSSSRVGVLLQGSGFLNTRQYGYGVSGMVLGQTKPESVLDNPNIKVCPVDDPDCATVDQVQADCQTTGPMTVAYAANPFATGSGVWWASTSPYQHYIDVALNNPSRWRRVEPSQVADPHLQCRGPANAIACYASNQPPTETSAADVWGSLFYHMKGLLVTDGGTAGPLRNTAAVGDTIFLQARVYNYSLKAMPAGTTVYARFYRQQLTVDKSNGGTAELSYATDAGGNPLPAVPIGPGGLGDPTPVKVVSPVDGSATIPPFNTSSDNISLATTSYTAKPDDDCQYDGGVQSCNGAYYVYWVTVWAENPSSEVISELPGHGLGASFDPNTIYHFITDVPLDSVSLDGRTDYFTNNVGMFKMLFSIVPAQTGAPSAAARVRPGPVRLARLHVSKSKTAIGVPVTVSAQVVELGGAAPGATVIFGDGDPQVSGKSFDAEWLPRIPTRGRDFVEVNYDPLTCGRHEIYAEVTGGSNVRPAKQVVEVDVGVNHKAVLGYMIRQVESLAQNSPENHTLWWTHNASARHNLRRGFDIRQLHMLSRDLHRAERALDAQRTQEAVGQLRQFTDRITDLAVDGRISQDRATVLLGEAKQLTGCIQ